MISICCVHCGHVDDIDLFTSTPIGGDLPLGTYQCPACHHAWRLTPSAKRRYVGGTSTPETITIQPISAQL